MYSQTVPHQIKQLYKCPSYSFGNVSRNHFTSCISYAISSLVPLFPLPSSFFVLLSPFSLSVSRSNLSHSHHQKGNQITLSLTWPVKICFTYRNGHFWPPCASVSFISLRCHIQYSWHVSNNIRFTCQGYYQRFSTTRHCIRRLHVK